MKKQEQQFWAVRQADKTTADILLYGYISPYAVSAQAFVKELQEIESKYKNINVRINSGGGSVFEGIAIYNALKNSKAAITVYVDGLAASMASIIALAGEKVYISHNAKMMTHKPTTGADGTSEDLKRSAQLLDDLEDTIADIYALKTGKDVTNCRQLFLNGKDNWFNAQQAVENGLADEIYTSGPAKKEAKSEGEEMAYLEYAMQLNDDKNQQAIKMEKLELTAEQLGRLPGITATSAQADVDAVFENLLKNAAAVAQLKQDLSAAQAAKIKAETDFENYKKADEANKTATLLSDAVTAGKVTQEVANELAADYAGNYDGLKKIIDLLPAYTPITAGLAGEGKEEVKALLAQSGSELFVNGGFDRLKKLDAKAFDAKWKEYQESK